MIVQKLKTFIEFEKCYAVLFVRIRKHINALRKDN